MSNELLEAFAVGTPRLRSISIARAGRDSILNESGLLSLARFEQLNEVRTVISTLLIFLHTFSSMSAI